METLNSFFQVVPLKFLFEVSVAYSASIAIGYCILNTIKLTLKLVFR